MVYNISFGTFVKNEEDNLLRMFDSVFEFVKEMIVVDTGSTDSTIDIIKMFKKRFEDSGRVFKDSYLQIDEMLDFAGMRNSIIDQASEEWVFMLDGDEELCKGECGKFEELMNNKQYQAWHLLRRNHLPDGGLFADPDWQGRFFRNLPHVRYIRQVHEYLPVPLGKAVNGPHIEHYHFLKPDDRKLKSYKLYDKIESMIKK